MLLPFSGPHSKTRQEETVSMHNTDSTCYVLHTCWRRVLFDYEDGGFKFFRNVGKLRAEYI
jgi:hypothetical protein